MSPRFTLPLATLATLAAAASAFSQLCTPHWSDQHPSGLTGDVECFATFDADGDGPQPPLIIAGGQITDASTQPAANIAAWDGFRWSPLGPGLDGEVRALATYDPDGAGPEPVSLYAAGTFTHSGDLPCQGIARWDGSAWHSLNIQFNKTPYSLFVFDPDADGPQPPSLFIGGVFTQVDGHSVHAIIGWDGNAWSPVGGGLDGGVYTMTAFDPDGAGPGPARLIAAGYFPKGEGKTLNNIALWDGSAWQPLDGGTDKEVRALAVFDIDGAGPQPEALYAGGYFTLAGGKPAANIARFSAGHWEEVASGIDGGVASIAVFDPDGPLGTDPGTLCIGGSFPWSVAKLNDFGWGPLDPGASFYDPVLAVYSGPRLEPGHGGDPAIYIGVPFSWGSVLCAKACMMWDGGQLLPLHWGLACEGRAAAVLDPDGDGPELPKLFVSTASAVEQVPSRSMARFDGQAWTPAGQGLDGPTYGLAVVDAGAGPGLFGRGDMPGYVRQWTGSSWQPLGVGCDDYVSELLQWDPDGVGQVPPRLLAAGEFKNAGGAAANLLALWDGASWSAFSPAVFHPYYAHIEAATVWDADGDGQGAPALAVFGIFDAIDGQPYERAALWDGAWHPLPEVPGGGNYFGAAQFDEDGPGPAGPSLFIAGSFYPHVVRWSGQEWTTVGDGFEGDGPVLWAKTLDPDGAGPAPAALYVGGGFNLVGIGPASIARWDGVRWERLGLMSDLIPSEGRPLDAAFYSPAGDVPTPLYVVGAFNQVDDTPSSNIAVLECQQPPCPADCNADSVLDLFDFLCFVNLYNAHDPAADCTAEGDFDFFDFVCFINLFNAGC